LGDGTNSPSYKPKQIGDDQAWVFVSASSKNSFGIKSNGTLWAWGDNGYGQLGDGSTSSSLTPKQIGDVFDNWVKVTPGESHTIGVKSKNYNAEDAIIQNTTLWAWGSNFNGQLGDGTTNSSFTPKQIGDSENWAGASSGMDHTLGKISDGTLWAWGWNAFGELGDGTTNQSNFPKQIGVDADWEIVEAGGGRSFAVKSDGTIWGWGYNNGLLGDGSEIERHEPVKIFPTNKNVSTIVTNYLLNLQ
jgi:alpha-tubulin suppressor-like RCC1 family protein